MEGNMDCSVGVVITVFYSKGSMQFIMCFCFMLYSYGIYMCVYMIQCILTDSYFGQN